MSKTCKNCSGHFEVTDNDREFYKKVKVPEPTHCPKCRDQRRLSFRNERALFKRKCDLCEKSIISFYNDDVKFPVYCVECWWSDKWDPYEYGRDFDFSRPFFPQFKELLDVVPQMSLLQLDNENCPYNTLLAFSKNTHMSPGSYFMEDCYYCRKSQNCQDCLDSDFLDHCELVKSSINCSKCYSCQNLMNCRNCRDSQFLADCTGCSNCYMCSGLIKAEYHYKNKKYSKEEYEKIVSENKHTLEDFLEFNKTVPKKATNKISCENSTGDYLQNCKNAEECYDCFDLEDCKYVTESVTVKDSMDLSMHDKDIELCYEASSGGDSNTLLRFSFCTISSYESDYMFLCFYLKESFGCVSVQKKNKHCILNKRYSEEEYQKLRARIIEHMKETGEYGEYFPASLSPHPYNNSSASYYYPMTKEEVLAKGWRWQDPDPREFAKSDFVMPERLEDLGDDVLNEVLACVDCGKNYKILPQELSLCKKIKGLPSSQCVDCRAHRLSALRNPRKLWGRECGKCGCDVSSTYPPESPETTYCEKCYLGEL